MARTESAILADISSTNAKINTLIGGIGVAGDYRDGEISTNRAGVISVLQTRLTALQRELSEVPSIVPATADIAVDETGADETEYQGDEYYA